MHLTIVGNLPLDADLDKLKNEVSKVDVGKISFEIIGINSFTNGSSFTALPIGFDLHDLREKLRKSAGFEGDNFASFIPYYEYLGWINFLRYKKQPKVDFIDKLVWMHSIPKIIIKPKLIEIIKTTSKLLDKRKIQKVLVDKVNGQVDKVDGHQGGENS